MKRLMLLFCLLASFIACSDDKDNPEEPKMPITDLQLPTVNPVVGDNVTIAGKGFAQDCKIQVKPEGVAEAIDAAIVEVTDAGITFKAPAEVTGKCKVILLQGGKSYELGDLTFEEAPDIEATLYGVFADETTNSVCPIDVATQRRGKALFTLDSDIEGIVADNHGMVYYKAITFVDNKSTYELRYYDIKAGKGGKIDWADAGRCFSISTDGEKLYALTYDTDSYDICLYSVECDGNVTLLQTYTDQLEAPYRRLYSTGGTFLYGESYIFAGLRLDMGDVAYHISIVADLTDDYYDYPAAEDMMKSFHFVKTGDNHYVFKNNEGEDATAKTTVHEFGEEYEWYGDDYNNPVIATIDNYFVDQVYDPTTGLIYGMFGDESDGILPFDPKTNKALDPWIGSGCVALVYIKDVE